MAAPTCSGSSTATINQEPPSAPPPAASSQPSSDSALHEIQLRYKLSPASLKTLLAIGNTPSRRDVLQTACHAAEFRSFPIKQAERGFIREINEHTAVPYPIAETISQPWHKVFLLIQIDLHGQGWPNKLAAKARKDLLQESGRIYKLVDTVLRCLADLLGHKGNGRALSVALDVLRSVKARAWEGSGKDLLQIQGIGQAKMKKLVDAGVNSIKQLSRMEFYHIERLLSRNPPFGQQLKHQLATFPVLSMNFEILGHCGPFLAPGKTMSEAVSCKGVDEDGAEMHIGRITLGYQNEKLPTWKTRTPWTTLVIEGQDGRLVWFWRGSVKRLSGGKEMLIALKLKDGEELKVTFTCEEITGTLIRETYTVK